MQKTTAVQTNQTKPEENLIEMHHQHYSPSVEPVAVAPVVTTVSTVAPTTVSQMKQPGGRLEEGFKEHVQAPATHIVVREP